jgi:uncharacterized protein (DUF952 family)
MIYHIVAASDWQRQSAASVFTAPSLETQGFIHCSTREQVVDVANFLFRGVKDLVLLCIDESKLRSSVTYENLEGGERLFPHVYGPIERDAIIATVAFEPYPDGSFTLPPTLPS